MAVTPTGVTAFGSLLYLGDLSSPTNYSLIPNVSSIKGGGFKASNADVTAHTTGVSGTVVAGQPWMQKVPTLLDGGDLTFDLFFVPSEPTHGASTGLLSCFTTRSVRPFKIVMPSSPVFTVTFLAFVSNFPFDLPINDVIKTTVTLTITASVTFV